MKKIATAYIDGNPMPVEFEEGVYEKWATVTSINPFNVKFDGELNASPKIYKKPKTYTPTVNDRVCFLVLNGRYVCLGAYV